MSKFMGTPGPRDSYESKDFCGSTIFHVAQKEGAPYTPSYSDVASTVLGERPEIQKDNARLISAAPELLEALQYALETLKDCDMDLFHNVIEVGDAAIAKALGEQ